MQDSADTYNVQLTKDDYELPTLTPKVLAVGKEVSLGRGFHLIKCATAHAPHVHAVVHVKC